MWHSLFLLLVWGLALKVDFKIDFHVALSVLLYAARCKVRVYVRSCGCWIGEKSPLVMLWLCDLFEWSQVSCSRCSFFVSIGRFKRLVRGRGVAVLVGAPTRRMAVNIGLFTWEARFLGGDGVGLGWIFLVCSLVGATSLLLHALQRLLGIYLMA